MPLDTSRRQFLGGSIAIAGVFTSHPAPAVQGKQPTVPVIDLNATKIWGGCRIVEISVVVKDAEKSAQCLADVFGVSWTIYAFKPERVVVHDRKSASECVLKVAIGYFGGYAFRLVQPVSGASSHREFLERHGSGFYSLGLGALAVGGKQTIVERFASAGVGTEMQGEVGNGARFAVLDTVEHLGCRIELTTPPQLPGTGYFRPTGRLTPGRASAINMDNPAIAGGRRFDEIGIVVKDEKRAVERFGALLGIDRWGFSDGRFRPTSELLYGKPVAPADLAAEAIGAAYAYAGGSLLELLSPGTLYGSHGVYLEKHGPGIQMLRMNSEENFDAEVAALVRAGLVLEREAKFYPPGKTSGPHSVAVFLNIGEDLSGFVVELFCDNTA